LFTPRPFAPNIAPCSSRIPGIRRPSNVGVRSSPGPPQHIRQSASHCSPRLADDRLFEPGGSKLLPDGQILEVIGETRSQILTQHFDLRRLPKGWMALHLERTREEIGWDDRVALVRTLLNAVAELHVRKVAHRDLGFRNIWVESTTRLSIGGFTSAILPDDELPGEWLSELAGYAAPLVANTELANDWQRDVYHLGLLARAILFHGEEALDALQNQSLGTPQEDVFAWLSKAIGPSASARSRLQWRCRTSSVELRTPTLKRPTRRALPSYRCRA
jgi:Protein tyrosine and serine/threonine kinase